ncbi:hypothetical protein DO72_5669 [Burkholderia pseudomallei]|nr:hypothetical protein DO62_6096 [Burkholderia pseudomallei]KGC71241.1 hypothetical protein DP56_6166 [Burkholderia pseudomallei]KGC81029.1 hypothetical protein DP61_5844 [Burkholderia pseudomallei]KGD24724.1 hypothetical protein DO70_5227 [Burkholderia pseudomallei]KGD31599.1 hypothetical protein DP59_6007 [Burkholderia pseudomallei]
MERGGAAGGRRACCVAKNRVAATPKIGFDGGGFNAWAPAKHEVLEPFDRVRVQSQ